MLGQHVSGQGQGRQIETKLNHGVVLGALLWMVGSHYSAVHMNTRHGCMRGHYQFAPD